MTNKPKTNKPLENFIKEGTEIWEGVDGVKYARDLRGGYPTKTNEEWIEGLVKIGKKNKTLLSLSMKTGEYTLNTEAEDLILKALQAKDLEHKEREEELKADIRHLMGVGDEFPLIKKNGRYVRPHESI